MAGLVLLGAMFLGNDMVNYFFSLWYSEIQHKVQRELLLSTTEGQERGAVRG